jgi:hypothetical protein
MKICFWNIAPGMTATRQVFIESLISEKGPDVFCVAEGPRSIDACQLFVSAIENLGYESYYNPLFYTNPKYNIPYGWERFGLKVFTKRSHISTNQFNFTDQKIDGRIIYLRIHDISIFFLHATSKVQESIKQHFFIVELSNFIRTKTRDNPDDRIVLAGDFNAEPWDDLLRSREFIESHFYKKSFEFHAAASLDNRVYWNPILMHVDTASNQNLIGTHFKNKWFGFFDFALFSKNITTPSIEIVTEIDSTNLLKPSDRTCEMVDEFDHLPIMFDIN